MWSPQPSRLYARVLTAAFPGRVGEQSRASLTIIHRSKFPVHQELAMQALPKNEGIAVSLSLSIRFNRLRSNLRFRLVLASEIKTEVGLGFRASNLDG